MDAAFSPVGATVNLAATTSTGAVALTDIGHIGSKAVRVYNSGASTVFIAFGTSSIVATTAAGMPVPAGAIETFEISGSVTHVAGITASGTSTVYFTSGRGL